MRAQPIDAIAFGAALGRLSHNIESAAAAARGRDTLLYDEIQRLQRASEALALWLDEYRPELLPSFDVERACDPKAQRTEEMHARKRAASGG